MLEVQAPVVVFSEFLRFLHHIKVALSSSVDVTTTIHEIFSGQENMRVTKRKETFDCIYHQGKN